MAWWLEVAGFAKDHWQTLVGTGLGGVVMKIWDRVGERRRRADERERWEKEQETARLHWEGNRHVEHTKMQYPKRHEAFGAFASGVDDMLEVIEDQRRLEPTLTRAQACQRMTLALTQLSRVLTTKVALVAPATRTACETVMDDSKRLLMLGDDDRVSWYNSLVDHLHLHAEHVRQVFAVSLEGDGLLPDPVQPRPGYQAGYMANLDDEHPEIVAFYSPLMDAEDRARIARGQVPRSWEQPDTVSDPSE